MTKKPGLRTAKRPREHVLILMPAYRWQGSMLTASSVAKLSAMLERRGIRCDVIPMHGNPVSKARTLLLERALTSIARTALWMDSDIYWPAHRANQVAEHIASYTHDVWKRPTVASYAARLLDGRWNRSAHTTPPQKDRPLTWSGTGMMAVDLDWYRKHWPTSGTLEDEPGAYPWFTCPWVRFPTGDVSLMTEDAWHCMQVSALGGTIIDTGITVEHAHGGTHEPAKTEA